MPLPTAPLRGVEVSAVLDATLAVAAIYVALTLKVTAGEVMGETLPSEARTNRP